MESEGIISPACLDCQGTVCRHDIGYILVAICLGIYKLHVQISIVHMAI